LTHQISQLFFGLGTRRTSNAFSQANVTESNDIYVDAQKGSDERGFDHNSAENHQAGINKANTNNKKVGTVIVNQELSRNG
jgi:hypothetical protein